MVKIPATAEGIPAIQQMHQRRHQHQRDAAVRAGQCTRKLREAYIAGLETYAARRRRYQQDRQRGQLLRQPHRQHGGRNDRRQAEDRDRFRQESSAERSDGQGGHRQCQAHVPVNIRKFVNSPRWKALAGKGAQTQRLLWASTSTKNPNYRDVMYVEELDRSGHGGHDSAGHLRRFPRPRTATREPDGGRRSGARHDGMRSARPAFP